MSNPYEFVRYPGKPIPKTHPDRLATMAALYGLETQSIFNARILEIGCCDGGNLISMAMSLPGSHFVGIDLTESDIAEAQEFAAALGISNVEFHCFDLTDLPGPFGQFDFIVSHGLYSWVPPLVREKLIAVIQACLAPRGVAYVSYNALPGGHFRLMIREMTLFHLKGTTEPAARLRRAREFLTFLKGAMIRNKQPEALLRQLDFTIRQPDYGLFHDELADDYHPAYIQDFVNHANRYGLQFLSEASYFVTRPEILGSDAAPLFAQVSEQLDPVSRAQYLDFMTCAFFHPTLLCHEGVELQRPVTPERLKRFYFASPATVVPRDPEADPETESFEGVQGSRISSSSPFLGQLMHAMIDVYPRSVHYRNLPGAESMPQELCGTLLALMNMGIVAPHIYSPDFCMTPGERPAASPLARMQAAKSRRLTDLRHSAAEIEDALQLALIPLLDGTRSRADLLAALPENLLPDSASLEAALLSLGQSCLLVS